MPEEKSANQTSSPTIADVGDNDPERAYKSSTVTVLYFAQLREERGCSEEQLGIDSSTPSELFVEIFGRQPDGIGFAINQSLASGKESIQAGDVIAYLPPFGGG